MTPMHGPPLLFWNIWHEHQGVRSLERACVYLWFSGEQWLVGEEALARDEAVAILQNAIRLIQHEQKWLS